MVSHGGIVWIGFANPLYWQLIEDSQPLDPGRAAMISRVALRLAGITIDSETHPDLVTGVGTNSLAWTLGYLPDLAGLIGTTVAARLIVYSPDWPDGLVWDDAIRIAIR